MSCRGQCAEANNSWRIRLGRELGHQLCTLDWDACVSPVLVLALSASQWWAPSTRQPVTAAADSVICCRCRQLLCTASPSWRLLWATKPSCMRSGTVAIFSNVSAMHRMPCEPLAARNCKWPNGGRNMKACLTAHVSAGGSSAFRTGSHTTTTLQRSATWWSAGGQRWASALHTSRLEYMLWCVIVCPLFAW